MQIRNSDSVFSQYIRTRDNWTCQRCKMQYEPPTKALQCSHFFGRGRESVRFDPDNCIALCHGCHRFWEKEDREAYRDYMIEWLGQEKFDALTIRQRLPGKRDDKLDAMTARAALNDLLKERNQQTFGGKA